MRHEKSDHHQIGRRLIQIFSALALLLIFAPALAWAGGSTPPPAWQPSGKLVEVSPEGYFYLNGKKTIVMGAEEERHIYTEAEIGQMIPRLKQMGVNFLVIYVGNPQQDFFYEKLAAAGIYVAVHLGTLKKETQEGFSNTGGVIGTIPDEEWMQMTLARIQEMVPRLARFNNILFWWLGGEFVEAEFHSADGMAAVRDAVRRTRDAVRALDPKGRPFTVSHHYVEAVEDPLLPFIDYRDLTDFTWFTVATHMHWGDFAEGGGWWPVLQESEPGLILESILSKAYDLNGKKAVFFGGFFGQAPWWGPCKKEDQYGALKDKWNILKKISHSGGSAYHATEWDGNDIPHRLFERVGDDWIPTPAGRAFQEINAAEHAVQ